MAISKSYPSHLDKFHERKFISLLFFRSHLFFIHIFFSFASFFHQHLTCYPPGYPPPCYPPPGYPTPGYPPLGYPPVIHPVICRIILLVICSVNHSNTNIFSWVVYIMYTTQVKIFVFESQLSLGNDLFIHILLYCRRI